MFSTPLRCFFSFLFMWPLGFVLSIILIAPSMPLFGFLSMTFPSLQNVWDLFLLTLVRLPTLALLCPLAFLIGSIPFGVISARIFNLGNLKSIGSGNIGATNVLRTGNKWAAALTFFGDFLKGVIAVIFINIDWLKALGYPTFSSFAYIVGLSVVLGHIFSVFLKFKGGKGVATAFGAVAVWQPFLSVTMIILWILAVKLSKVSAKGALTAFISAPFLIVGMKWLSTHVSSLHKLSIFITAEHNQNVSIPIWPYVALAIIIVFTHRSNIQAIIQERKSKK